MELEFLREIMSKAAAQAEVNFILQLKLYKSVDYEGSEN